MRTPAISGSIVILCIALPGAAAAQGSGTNPYLYPDDSYISVSGTVRSVTSNAFTLDFDGGEITVEMDDGDRDADAYNLVAGDHVTVYGRVDDDFFETSSIEAGSVYVEKLDTFFYASSIDEEHYDFIEAPTDPSQITVQGRVTDVDAEAEEFSIDTGRRDFRVEVDRMPYNPLDGMGYQDVDIGDVVSVRGDIDYEIIEGRRLVADSVTTIHDLGA